MAERNFHIAKRLNHLPDLQKSNLWEVSIEVPMAIQKGYASLPVIKQTGDTTTELKIRAMSCGIPKRELQKIEKKWYGGQVLPYAAPENMGSKTVTIKFDEFEDQYNLLQLNYWINLIWNSMDTFGVHGGHSAAGVVERSQYTSEVKLIYRKLDSSPLEKGIIFHGAFPTKLDPGSNTVDYEQQPKKVDYSLDLSYSHWSLFDVDPNE